MEIRLFDLINNKVDVRDYMFIHDGKIMVNADYVYKVILDTNKVTLQQQIEIFDSKDEMFRKARAFDEIAITVLQETNINTQQMNNEVTQIVIKNLKE